MDNLRWILLGAGVLFVLAIYLLSRKRRSDKDTYTYVEPEEEFGFAATDLDAVDEGVGEVRVIASTRDDDFPERELYDEPFPNEEETSTEPPPVPELITVYIMTTSDDQRFTGDRINSAARSCGLVFGDMDIYHRLDDADRPVFSLANMLNPGSFDPATMLELQTTGLAVFMQLEMVEDPDAAIDDMLSSAYQISELLGGRLCNHKHTEISQQDTEEYRELAANY